MSKLITPEQVKVTVTSLYTNEEQIFTGQAQEVLARLLVPFDWLQPGPAALLSLLKLVEIVNAEQAFSAEIEITTKRSSS